MCLDPVGGNGHNSVVGVPLKSIQITLVTGHVTTQSVGVNGYSLRSLAIFTGYDTISVFHDITLLP